MQDKLGWYGDLALSPPPVPKPEPNLTAVTGVGPVLVLSNAPDVGLIPREEALQPATNTFWTILCGFFAAGGLGFLGSFALLVFVFLALAGMIRGGIQTGSLFSGVYAETFALWMPVFLGLNIAAGLTAPEGYEFLCAGVAFFLSLIVLLWPILRGVPFSVMLKDIGLKKTDGNPLMEIPWGLACYVMSLPFLFVGFLVMLGLILGQKVVVGFMQGEGNEASNSALQGASHPIVEHLADAQIGFLLQIFLVASVAAPIVEEIMFRGVLYRHLRELTSRWGFLISAAVSALVVSFIFAVVHPQGFLAIPVLMALAFGFTIFREWRGSLIPSIIAHGLSNGLVLTLVVLALG